MSEIYMDCEAVLRVAASVQNAAGRLDAKRQELAGARGGLGQVIGADAGIGYQLSNIDSQLRELYARLNKLRQVMNDAVNAYAATDRGIQGGVSTLSLTRPNAGPGTTPTATGAKKPKGGTESWWQKAGDFIYDHRKAIIIAAAAVVLIGVGIATCGAGDAVLAPALAAALGMGSIGAGTGLMGEEVSDYLDDGKVDNSDRSYVGTAAGGFVAGAVCPVGGAEAVTVKGVAIAAGKNAVSGMAGDALGQEISTGKIDARQVIETGAISGVLAGGATFLAGKLTGGHPIIDENEVHITTKALSSEEAEEYAFNSIKGKNNADSVMLGKYEENSLNSYDKIAKDYGSQYFNLDDWDELSTNYPKEEIWKINERFLDIQTSSGREVYLSHNPDDYIGDGSFYSKELKYLVDNGYRFVNEGDVWHAIR